MPADTPAESSPFATSAAADIADLVGTGYEELEQVFADGAEPDENELDGSYGGRVLMLAALRAVPSPVRAASGALFALFAGSPFFPWRGKKFGPAPGRGRGGTNIWLTPWGPHFARFECHLIGGSLALEYLPPLASVQGEVRRVAPGLYLGRVALRVGSRTLPVAFFSLDNA